MKFLVTAFLTLASVTSFAEDFIVKQNKASGSSQIVENVFESGRRITYVYIEGKSAKKLFNVLDKDPKVTKTVNSDLDQRILGKLFCMKFLKEKNRILCSQPVSDYTP